MEINAIDNLVHIPINLDRFINSLQALCIVPNPALGIYDLRTCLDGKDCGIVHGTMKKVVLCVA